MGDSDHKIFSCAYLSSGNPDTDLDGDGWTSPTDYGLFGEQFARGEPGPSGLATSQPPPETLPYDDADLDEVLNYLDNCLNAWNPGQTNSDHDLFGNACDADYNNADGVDQTDVAAFALFLFTTVEPDGENAEMDHTGDGVINMIDFAVLAGQFGGPPGPSGLACAPPPGPLPLEAIDGYLGVIRGRSYRGSLVTIFGGGTQSTHAIVSGPSAGSVVLDDATTGAFTYTSNPGASATDDSFSFTATNNLGTSNEATVRVSIWDPAGTTFTTTEQTSKALIVYNSNYAPALSIAEHYRSARGIDPSRLCAVEMPNGLYARGAQLTSLRKQIVENCVCAIIPEQERPSPCLAGDPVIAAKSPVTHLVLIKGLPARLFETGWSDDFNEPALDHYLSYLLYRDEDIFDCPSHCPGPPVTFGYPLVRYDYNDQTAATYPYYYRALEPARERFLAYGRVEAITPERTLALIDRTLAAEAAGFTGNMLSETAGLLEMQPFGTMRRATASFAPACTDYLTHSSSTWPHEQCRAGTTYADPPNPQGWVSGVVPGAPGAKVPVAVRAGIFLGGNAAPNGQEGFGATETLRNWHRAVVDCTNLCADVEAPDDPQACAARSTDYFRVLNTDCVGAAPGLIGHQHRSHPVGYYGFFPPGWDSGGGDGQNESTPPQLLTGGAFTNETFTDDRYLHLGVHSTADPDESLCVQTNGSHAPCREQIALLLQQHFELGAGIPNNGRSFRVRVRHRNQASPNGKLWIDLDFQDGNLARYVKSDHIPLTEANSDWEPDEVMIAADSPVPGFSTIHRLTLSLRIYLANPAEGFLDLDGIELIDEGTTPPTPLLATPLGSFASDVPDRTTWGTGPRTPSTGSARSGGGAPRRTIRTASGTKIACCAASSPDGPSARA